MYPYHHPGAQRIFELPVYRCTEEQLSCEQKASCAAAAQPVAQSLKKVPLITPERVAQEVEDFKSRWRQREAHCWDFNEVVGWIRLYARPGSIGASLFILDKRISRTLVRKRFLWDSWNFIDMSVSKKQSNAEIFETLKKLILAESRERFNQRRYVDIGVLDALGPHLDWVALTQWPV
jgi:hypothetical protein